MSKVTLKTLEEKLNSIELEANREMNDIRGKLEVIDETIRTTTQALNKAREDGDEEAFLKASSEQKSANEIARMYQDKMKKIASRRLITKEEYLELKRSIIQCLDEVVAEGYQKMLPLMAELKALKEQLCSDLNNGNMMLNKVQRELYKEPEVREEVLPDGRIGRNVSVTDKYYSNGPVDEINSMLINHDRIIEKVKGDK